MCAHLFGFLTFFFTTATENIHERMTIDYYEKINALKLLYRVSKFIEFICLIYWHLYIFGESSKHIVLIHIESNFDSKSK